MAAVHSPLTITPSNFLQGQYKFTLTLPQAAFQPNGPSPSTFLIHPAQILTHLTNDVISVLNKLQRADNNHPNPPLYDLFPSSEKPPRINTRGELEMSFRVDRNHATADAGWLRNPNLNPNPFEIGERLRGMEIPIVWSGGGIVGDVARWLAMRGFRGPVTAVEFQWVFRCVAAFRQLAPW
ncbi:hypothetical protein DL98DRAFT_528920 [Cadophora sp. DSE1049]|nr:hypothetical protein DL98DRAFT_528920 [Cadophora sp. DSE1049]